MRVVLKFLMIVVFLYGFTLCSVGVAKIESNEELKYCKAQCYKQHEICLSECDKQRQLHAESDQQFSYNKCKYELENKKCLPELNHCMTTKCHPFFKA